MKYRLGLKPVTTQPLVRLRDYYTADLPTVDSLKFPLGQPNLIKPQMYLNNVLGCCGIAGSFEEVRQANALRGVTVNFTDQTVVENYSAFGYVQGPEITGFNPDGSAIINPDAPQNPTDQGVDVHDLFQYRQNTGMLDADGGRHEIVGYAGLSLDPDEWLIALSLFEMFAIGLQVPDYAEDQFEDGQPWHLIPGRHSLVGGHYIPVFGAPDTNNFQPITWDKLIEAQRAFLSTYATVAVVALTREMFGPNGNGPAGVDFDALAADLPRLGTGTVTAKAPLNPPTSEMGRAAGPYAHPEAFGPTDEEGVLGWV
ncbi:MAG: hypothetical protein J2P17_18100 [Mycobacterium sp.]|nr:hypothetical protein [Mycobacterium sp.]